MDKDIQLRSCCTSKGTICFDNFEFKGTVSYTNCSQNANKHIRGDPKEKQHPLSQIRIEHPVE